MKRFFFTLSAMLLVASHAVLFVPYSASAASIYDDAYISTDYPIINQVPSEPGGYSLNVYGIVGSNNPSDVLHMFDYALYGESFTWDGRTANFGGYNLPTGINIESIRDSFHNIKDYAITNRCYNSDGWVYQFCTLNLIFTDNADLSLNWSPYGVYIEGGPGVYEVVIQTNTSLGIYRTEVSLPTQSNTFQVSGDFSYEIYENVVLNVTNENIPENYAGEPLVTGGGGSGPVNTICPVYQVTVAQNGLLRIVYEGNISPFLTGISYIVVNETYDEWTTLGPEIMNESVNPAGWMDWSGDVLLEPNSEYLIRISHNQQLSTPPWTTQPTVDDVWIQVLYNGETQYTFTTKGCGSEITNPITFEGNETESIFQRLNLDNDEFGLGAAVTAPLQFIGNLPSMAESCVPLVLPLPFVNSNITLPCMTPIYQDKFPQILNIFQTVMLGLFGYYAAVKVYGNIKQLKDPRDDQIEVVKL